MSFVVLVIPTLLVTVQTLTGGGCGYRIREGSRIETPWSHPVYITPDSATIDMKVWAGSRRDSLEDKAAKTLWNCAS